MRTRGKRTVQLPVRFGDLSRFQPRFRDGGHEVRVAHPSWHDVQVHALRRDGPPQTAFASLRTTIPRARTLIARKYRRLQKKRRP